MDRLVKERLRTFIASRDISIRRFEILCGFPNSFVSNIKRTTSPARLEVIASKFPELNITWLMTGKGEMLNAPHLESSQTSQTEEESMQLQQHCEKLLAQLEKQQSQIETLIEQNNRLLQLLQQKM
ncbi:MAG: hypothetical protein IIV10_05575 [Alistipes sp.]|nr:hypothetical protein [Alistipes sp.]